MIMIISIIILIYLMKQKYKQLPRCQDILDHFIAKFREKTALLTIYEVGFLIPKPIFQTQFNTFTLMYSETSKLSTFFM